MNDDMRQAPLENPEKDTGRDVPDGMTKARASELIDELRQETGRGAD